MDNNIQNPISSPPSEQKPLRRTIFKNIMIVFAILAVVSWFLDENAMILLGIAVYGIPIIFVLGLIFLIFKSTREYGHAMILAAPVMAILGFANCYLCIFINDTIGRSIF
jgi:hypothetical protein